MATYVDIGDVTPRLGGRSVAAAGTSPTIAEVVEWLDEAEGELLGTLEAVGVSSTYAIPSRGANLIRGWVSKYVAQLVVHAHETRDGLATVESRRVLEEEWRAFLRWLDGNPARSAAMLGGAAAPRSAVGISSHVSGQSETEREPIFKMSKYHL